MLVPGQGSPVAYGGGRGAPLGTTAGGRGRNGHTRTCEFRVGAGRRVQGGAPGICAIITTVTVGTDDASRGSCSCDGVWVGGGGGWGGEGGGGAGGGGGHRRGEGVVEGGREATAGCRRGLVGWKTIQYNGYII